MDALVNHGPLAISVAANSGWQFYSKGIYNHCDSSGNIDIDHAVVLVGYGSENGKDFWIVRNSWGSDWGENGYIRISRKAVPPCGTDTTPQHGVACKGDKAH